MDTSYEGENLEDSEGDDNPFSSKSLKRRSAKPVSEQVVSRQQLCANLVWRQLVLGAVQLVFWWIAVWSVFWASKCVLS